jgi:hypothetical protein
VKIVKGATELHIDFLRRRITIKDFYKVEEGVEIAYPRTVKYGLFSFLKALYMLLIRRKISEFLFKSLFIQS